MFLRGLLERLAQILFEIGDIFNADGETNQLIRNAYPQPLLTGKFEVGHTARKLRQAFDGAQ